MLVSLLYKLLRFLNLQLNIFNHIKAKHVIKQMVNGGGGGGGGGVVGGIYTALLLIFFHRMYTIVLMYFQLSFFFFYLLAILLGCLRLDKKIFLCTYIMILKNYIEKDFLIRIISIIISILFQLFS